MSGSSPVWTKELQIIVLFENNIIKHYESFFFLAFQTLYIKQCLTVKDKREYHWDGMYCESLLANKKKLGHYHLWKLPKKKQKKTADPGMCYITIFSPYNIEASANLLFTWTICNHYIKIFLILVSIMTNNILNVIKCDIFNGLERKDFYDLEVHKNQTDM